MALSAEDLVAGPVYGSKMLAVYETGIWEVHGKGRNIMWTKTASTIHKGDSSFTTIDAVDWKVGDKIIICTTDYDQKQTEERTVVSVQGTNVTVDTPFGWSHFGRILSYDGYSIDMRAEIGVLTSNVVIEVCRFVSTILSIF